MIPIDGTAAEIVSWKDNTISLKVTSPLADLEYPYTEPREIVVKSCGQVTPSGSSA